MIKARYLLHVLIVLLLMIPLCSHAEIFKCKNPDGSINFQDKPCTKTERLRRMENKLQEEKQAEEIARRKRTQKVVEEAKNQKEAEEKRKARKDEQRCEKWKQRKYKLVEQLLDVEPSEVQVSKLKRIQRKIDKYCK